MPDTIELAANRLTIHRRNMQHLVEQLVLVAKALDTDYETMRQQIESKPPLRKPALMAEIARPTSQLG